MNIERFFISYSRQVRRPYRYLAGDSSCLGFVRTAAAIFIILQIVAFVAFIAVEHATSDGFWSLVSGLWVLIASPAIFRQAAKTGHRSLGPVFHHPIVLRIHAGFSTVLLVAASFDFTSMAVHARVDSRILRDLAALIFIAMVWAIFDREGGGGKRTLAKDLKRLLPHRLTPVGMAG